MPTVRRSEEIEGVLTVDLTVHADARGTFVETWRQEWLPEASPMVQTNRSEKAAGSLVGLHYHRHQADYWYVDRGLARVVLHDLRPGSPTEGASSASDFLDAAQRGLYIPQGVAHGFAALSDLVLLYQVDRYYDPADELGLSWDDPDLGIDWGVERPVLSTRDQANPRRRDLAPDLLPRPWTAVPG